MDVLGGRYRLGVLLGRGGMADVYRADDDLLGRAVAVKVFGRDAEVPEAEMRQRTEVQLLASLAHPGLVTVFDAGTDTTDPDSPRSYLVLELVDGIALGRRLSLGPVPRNEVGEIGCQLAAALAYVHGCGIVHRDVKPANILLSSADAGDRVVAKLADFGIARLIDSAHITTAGTTVGTANYLSPEQVRGDCIGPASDIYSLGLVLLECLTGIRAYPGVGVEPAVVRLHRPPAIPPRLGPSWGGLLAAMTATDPAQRPSAAEALQAMRRLTREQTSCRADRSADNGEGVTDGLGPLPGLLWIDATDLAIGPGPHRRRAPLVVLAGVLCVAALVFFGFLRFGDSESTGNAATPPDTATSAPTSPKAPMAATTTESGTARAGTPKVQTSTPEPAPAAVVLRTTRSAVTAAPTRAAKPAKPAKAKKTGPAKKHKGR